MVLGAISRPLLNQSIIASSTVRCAASKVGTRWNSTDVVRTVPSGRWTSTDLVRTVRAAGSRMRPLAQQSDMKGPFQIEPDPWNAKLKIPGPRQLDDPIVGPDWIDLHQTSKKLPSIHRVLPIWLRDHCRCHECVHPETKQRLVDTFALPEDIAIKECHEEGENVEVLFSDGHRGHYTKEFLKKQGHFADAESIHHGRFKPSLWNSSIKERPPVLAYDAVMASDERVASWLRAIRRYGFAYVDGCPATPEATKGLLERIAFIRHTHYGGFWDFTSDLASKDTAYTSIALEAHTDNTYFSDPAGLQMFHLLSHTDGEGGASLLVDGFAVAKQLKQQHPDAYRLLANVRLLSHASGNEGIKIAPEEMKPVLEFSKFDQRLNQIRWNNSDRQRIHMSLGSVGHWYDAARKWAQLVKSPENEYWEQLKPGRALIFDNWRVLHGRSAFTGKRRLCGGYINRDDYLSRFRTLNRPDQGSMYS